MSSNPSYFNVLPDNLIQMLWKKCAKKELWSLRFDQIKLFHYGIYGNNLKKQTMHDNIAWLQSCFQWMFVYKYV